MTGRLPVSAWLLAMVLRLSPSAAARATKTRRERDDGMRILNLLLEYPVLDRRLPGGRRVRQPPRLTNHPQFQYGKIDQIGILGADPIFRLVQTLISSRAPASGLSFASPSGTIPNHADRVHLLDLHRVRSRFALCQ